MFGYMFAGSQVVGGLPSGISSMDARLIAEETSKPYEQKIQALELTCAAMWTILKDKLGVTDEELIQAIHEVDARDGVIDGKISQVSRVCPHCHRKVLTRNPTTCSWCGGSLAPVGT